jgi:hypothetical protein
MTDDGYCHCENPSTGPLSQCLVCGKMPINRAWEISLAHHTKNLFLFKKCLEISNHLFDNKDVVDRFLYLFLDEHMNEIYPGKSLEEIQSFQESENDSFINFFKLIKSDKVKQDFTSLLEKMIKYSEESIEKGKKALNL